VREDRVATAAPNDNDDDEGGDTQDGGGELGEDLELENDGD